MKLRRPVDSDVMLLPRLKSGRMKTVKNLIAIVFVVAFLFVPSTYTQTRKLTVPESPSQKRVALVVGNGAYSTAPLKNPVNDAQDIAQALRGLGFDVIYRENLNQNDMKRAIREFGARIRNGGVGLFYYAGHGVAVKGINYLVPVDAIIESEEEVEYECVDAGFVLAQMGAAGNEMNIVILDACRNNPFARSFRSASRGLAQMDAPSGTMIAYATAPGSVASDGNARNGLYTQELLKFMRTPGLDLENVFKQVRMSVRTLTQGGQTPWESSSLVGSFYFKSGPDGTKSASQTAPDQVLNFDAENTYSNPKTPIDAEAYLRQFGIATTKTPGTRVVLLNHLGAYDGKAFLPVSRPNILTQIGSSDPVTFTLTFSQPLSRLSFVLPPLIAATKSGITFPKWRAHVLDARGFEIASIGSDQFGSYEHEDSKTITLEAPGRGACIKAVRFDSDTASSAFQAILIDDLALWFAPSNSCK